VPVLAISLAISQRSENPLEGFAEKRVLERSRRDVTMRREEEKSDGIPNSFKKRRKRKPPAGGDRCKSDQEKQKNKTFILSWRKERKKAIRVSHRGGRKRVGKRERETQLRGGEEKKSGTRKRRDITSSKPLRRGTGEKKRTKKRKKKRKQRTCTTRMASAKAAHT